MVAPWVGNFESGDRSQYDLNQSASPDRVEIRTDSPRLGRYYARFTALDADVFPLTPTANPRAQLVRSLAFNVGDTAWISFSLRFPLDFPVIPPGGWVVLAQAHGPPFNGSPPIGIDVEGDNLIYHRDEMYNYDNPWTHPMVRGEWLDFDLHIHFALDQTGWVELYFQGQQQVFTNGESRLQTSTMEPGQTYADWVPTLYRKAGMFDSMSVDHDRHSISLTRPRGLTDTAAVERRRVRTIAGAARRA